MQTRTYKNYLLSVLLVIYASSNVDRLALGIVLQDIKAALHLSDTQLGLLTGIAFAAFYAVMGIPIARWADRGDRVRIISSTVALWSFAVALCGAAASFTQLLLIRICVAVGEAGCLPTSLSLIGDNFTRVERPRAIARYMLGAPLAFVVGYFAAGWLNELYGWRVTFVVLGLPGVILAALAALTLKEPRRARSVQARLTSETVNPPLPVTQAPSFKQTASILWANPAFRHLFFCYCVWYFFGYGILQWSPAFFVRSHGLQTGEIGTWFAAIYGVAGGIGTYLGGEMATRYAHNNERLQLRAGAVGFSSLAVLTAAVFLLRSNLWAFAALAVATFGSYVVQGPILAAIQSLAPARIRALSFAILYLFANLIGFGLGPLAAGMLSDALQPMFGVESLRFALVLLCPGYFWAAWHLWRASRTVIDDIATTQEDDARLTP